MGSSSPGAPAGDQDVLSLTTKFVWGVIKGRPELHTEEKIRAVVTRLQGMPAGFSGKERDRDFGNVEDLLGGRHDLLKEEVCRTDGLFWCKSTPKGKHFEDAVDAQQAIFTQFWRAYLRFETIGGHFYAKDKQRTDGLFSEELHDVLGRKYLPSEFADELKGLLISRGVIKQRNARSKRFAREKRDRAKLDVRDPQGGGFTHIVHGGRSSVEACLLYTSPSPRDRG